MSVEAGGFFRAGPREERTMKQRQLRMPGWVRNGDGKKACIFIIDFIELDSIRGSKLCETQPFPVKKIFRSGQGNSWPSRRKRRITHNVAPERLDEGDSGILASAATVWPHFIVDFWLQRDTESLDA